MTRAPAAALRPADAVDRSRLPATFLELVAVDSPTGHEQEIGDVLWVRFRGLGCTTTRNDVGNLVAVLPGTRPGTVLVSTHLDTAGTDRGIVPLVGGDGVVRTDGTTILGADDRSGPWGPEDVAASRIHASDEGVDLTEVEKPVVTQALLLQRLADDHVG